MVRGEGVLLVEDKEVIRVNVGHQMKDGQEVERGRFLLNVMLGIIVVIIIMGRIIKEVSDRLLERMEEYQKLIWRKLGGIIKMGMLVVIEVIVVVKKSLISRILVNLGKGMVDL